MIRVVIFGLGNVGQHLYSALSKANDVEVIQTYSRTLPKNDKARDLSHITNLDQLKEADLYIIALPDDVISEFSEELPIKGRNVVHTSGSVCLSSLSKKNNTGVFYPLQTFSKERVVDFSNVPICVEATDKPLLHILHKVGNSISNTVVEISSKERSKLHLAAVFVNNFTNHMYHIAADYLNQNNLSFELLLPLISETTKKITELSPKEAQTGPASRGDQETITKHLKALEDNAFQKVYKTLTKSIQKTHGKKL